MTLRAQTLDVVDDTTQQVPVSAAELRRRLVKITREQAMLRERASRYEGLARVFRATAGGNAQTLAGVYGDTAVLLERVATELDDLVTGLE